MSFLKTVPEELTAAAAQLGTIGAAMAAQNAAAAAPTTAIAPAALDEVSALQAALFTAYGTFYQQVSAEAQAMHDMFVNTLGISAGTYGVTESLNSSAAASPLGDHRGSVGHHPSDDGVVPARTLGWHWQHPQHRGRELGLRHVYADRPCRRRPPACRGGGRGRLGSRWGSRLGRIGCIGRGRSRLGEAGIAAGLGSASAIGMLSVPPAWAGQATLVSTTSTLPGAGWTAAAPQAAAGTFIPGMPGVASAARNSAGFGAPRYGVKPIVMPKPATV